MYPQAEQSKKPMPSNEDGPGKVNQLINELQNLVQTNIALQYEIEKRAGKVNGPIEVTPSDKAVENKLVQTSVVSSLETIIHLTMQLESRQRSTVNYLEVMI